MDSSTGRYVDVIEWVDVPHELAESSFSHFLLDLAEIIITTRQGLSSNYVHTTYDPTLQDIRFFGAIGFLGIIGYYVTMLGALCLIVFALHAFQSGYPDSRNRTFYQSRLVFYSIFSLLAAGSQLLLGVYVKGNVGSGPLSNPVSVAMYVIVYPEISIACGSVQAVTALFGFARAAGVSAQPDNHLYQCMAWFSWLMTIAGTAMAQVYLLPEGNGSGRAPTLIVLTFGASMLPSFLDYKMRNLPYAFPSDYYNTLETDEDVDGDKMTNDVNTDSDTDVEQPKEPPATDANEISIEAPLPVAIPVMY